MFKSVSWIVALSVVAAPMLPARAEPFGAPPFGRPPEPTLREVRSGGPVYRGSAPIVIQGIRRDRDWDRDRDRDRDWDRNRDWNRDRDWDRNRDRDWDRDRFGRPIDRRPDIIVAPVNGRPRFVPRDCGTVIYGSPIAAPVLVNPRTGLACR